MKSQISIIVFATLLLQAAPAGADATDGTVLALDRKARTLILADKTVWPLELLDSALPADLKAGDRIEIEYESDEEGVSAIKSIRVSVIGNPATDIPATDIPANGAADITAGSVLVLDRKAKILVLTDRTVWDLDTVKSGLPAGLKAGDRIEIDYESDEEGVSAINSITIKVN